MGYGINTEYLEVFLRQQRMSSTLILTICLLTARPLDSQNYRLRGPNLIRGPSSKISNDFLALREGHTHLCLRHWIPPSIHLSGKRRETPWRPASFLSGCAWIPRTWKGAASTVQAWDYQKFLAHQLNTSRYCQHRFWSGSGMCTGATMSQIRSVWHLVCWEAWSPLDSVTVCFKINRGYR